ncbi:unnamed protein product [Sphagnum balticum]
MSQPRIIKIPGTPESDLKKAFETQWEHDNCDTYIKQCSTLSRVYGIAATVILIEGQDSTAQLDKWKLWNNDISFNVLDPLNISGSVTVNQVPNAIDFLKTTNIRVAGVPYHKSRSVIQQNGQPIYLNYVTSGFGYTGISVYQRALFPLKSFVSSLLTDDLVVLKAGLLVAKIKGGGSVMDWIQDKLMGMKRAIIKEAQSGNVINIDLDEAIETLNMQNLDGAYSLARRNILENIAASDDMPAKLLNSETFAEGLRRYSMYEGIPYEQAFYEWKNAFIAEFPPLIEEEPSEKITVAKVKMESWIEALEVIMPELDSDNKVIAIEWLSDNMNELEELFASPLNLDMEGLKDFLEEKKEQQESMFNSGGEAENGLNKEPAPPAFPKLIWMQGGLLLI